VRRFWPLWLFLWAALNALFQAGDAFNLYVTLELLGLSAVALVALTGSGPALWGAMRYLLVSLLGSLAYLWASRCCITPTAPSISPCSASAPTAACPGGAAGRDDRRAVAQDGPVPVPRLVAARAWQRARAGQRAAFRAGGQGVVLPAAAALVHLHAGDQGLPILLGSLGAAAVFWGSIQALRQRA
jgi:multicomponent Na+:H+ antiporter subunit D